jgi:hypothetical protein
MKVTNVLYAIWLIAAAGSMIYMAASMWSQARQRKTERKEEKKRLDELHDMHMRLMRIQLKRAEDMSKGKEPWEP